MRIILAENENLIYVGVAVEGDRSLGWEELQSIKDKFYPNDTFIEVYPKSNEIVNHANERHLFCVKGAVVPDLSILEQEMDIKIIEE